MEIYPFQISRWQSPLLCIEAWVLAISLCESDMLHSSDDIAPNLDPIDTRVQFFIHEPTNRYIFSSYNIQAVSNLSAGLGVVMRAYDALDSLA